MTVKQDMARIPMKRPQGTLVRKEKGIAETTSMTLDELIAKLGKEISERI